MSARRRLALPVAIAAAFALAALLAQPAAAGDRRSPRAVPATGCAPGSVHRMRTARLSYGARALRRVRARRLPGGPVIERFGTVNVNGVATVFGVLAARVDASCRPVWLEVQLPIRPNGSTGWVLARDVALFPVRTRIAVDLSRRRVTLLRSGRPILVATVVVGAPSTPTPTGRYYVNQRLLTRSPTGPFGPGAVGISAFSPVLRSWPQGGPIAIHGTDAPGLIGFAVSYGCMRARNADIVRLLQLAVEGTPVDIRM